MYTFSYFISGGIILRGHLCFFFLIFDLLLLFFTVCPVIPQIYSEHLLCASSVSVHSCLFLLFPQELRARPGCPVPQTHLLLYLFLSLSVLCMFSPRSFLFLWLVSYSIRSHTGLVFSWLAPTHSFLP